MLDTFDIIIRIFNSSVRTHVLTPDDHIQMVFARGLSKWHLNNKSIAPSKVMIPFSFFRCLNNIFFHRIRPARRMIVFALRSMLICIILCSFQVVIYTVRIFYFRYMENSTSIKMRCAFMWKPRSAAGSVQMRSKQNATIQSCVSEFWTQTFINRGTSRSSAFLPNFQNYRIRLEFSPVAESAKR